MLEYVLRFVAGGIAVSAFAALGDTLRPKSFARPVRCCTFDCARDASYHLVAKGRSVCGYRRPLDDRGGLCAAAYCWVVCSC